jgi:hypothetical protein
MDDVFHYLKENLRLKIKQKYSGDPDDNCHEIVFSIKLDGKLITKDSILVSNGHILSDEDED